MSGEWVGLVWFAFAWLVGGFANGITGFGASMVAMPFVLWGMDITTAVPACSLMVLVVSLEQFWRYHDFIDWKRIIPILLGALPGAWAGALALQYLPSEYLKGGLGVFLVGYSLWGLLGSGSSSLIISKYWGALAGFFATTFGTAFSFNGPPLAVYATMTGWDKLTTKAGLSFCFVITSGIMIGSQMLAGLHGTPTLFAMLAGIPCSIIGAYFGFKVTRTMSDATYRRLLFLFIAGIGALFIVQSSKIIWG